MTELVIDGNMLIIFCNFPESLLMASLQRRLWGIYSSLGEGNKGSYIKRKGKYLILQLGRLQCSCYMYTFPQLTEMLWVGTSLRCRSVNTILNATGQMSIYVYWWQLDVALYISTRLGHKVSGICWNIHLSVLFSILNMKFQQILWDSSVCGYILFYNTVLLFLCCMSVMILPYWFYAALFLILLRQF